MSQQKNELKKVLGAGFGIAVLVGGTIGVGILRAPSEIASHAPDYWLIILGWIVMGVYVLLAAGPYAEMATMMPKAGGPYNYVKRALGDYAGFITGWFDYLLNSIAPAYFCIVIGEYIAILFPSLKGYEVIIGLGFLIVFMLFHLNGVRSGSIAQQITSVIKMVFFAGLIIACFFASPATETVSGPAPALKHDSLFLGFLATLPLIMGAYNGWWSNCFFAEEDKNPSRNIPRSLFTGVFLVIAIYVLLNMAYLHILSPVELAKSPLPASVVAGVVFGESGAVLVIIIAIGSIVSILNAYMMIPARILFGLSRDGFFIKQGVVVNKGGTPVVSLLLSTALSFVLIIVGSFEQLFTLCGLMSLIVMGLSFISHIKLRISEPHADRPYRALGYPLTTILILLATAVLVVVFAINDLINFSIVAGIALASIPVFILLRRKG